jgi:hypothetical protein
MALVRLEFLLTASTTPPASSPSWIVSMAHSGSTGVRISVVGAMGVEAFQLAILHLDENLPSETPTQGEGCPSDADLDGTSEGGGVHHAHLCAFREAHVQEALAGAGPAPYEGDNALLSGLQVGQLREQFL